ncbi:MAG: hypothetical protein HY560_00600, partial [Gemmatimonadetes bacterium]|nr:hypothetical protein [Gemmatimonadota bacterium]
PPPSPAWASVAPLATARFGFGAAVAAGRIYVIGGEGSGGIPLASVEVYSPTTNAWTPGPPLPEPRVGLAAVTGADGRVYVFGGRVPPFGDLTPSALVLDPSADGWTPIAPLPTPRDRLAAALGPDDRIYAIGGIAHAVLGTVEAYDPAAGPLGAWSPAAGLPTARALLAATTAGDGRIYAIGGSDGARQVGTVDAYTAGSDTWRSAGPLAPARAGLGAAPLYGRIYVAGGENFGLSVGTLVDVYSAATNAWTPQASLPMPHNRGATVTGPDGRLYTIGGIGPSGAVLAAVEAFRPTAPVPVTIDIQPGDEQNQIDLSSSGFVRVALLSSPTFDPKKAEGATVAFAGAPPLQLRSGPHPGTHAYDERELKGRDRDLNHDKKHDRIFRFDISGLNLQPGAVAACFAGRIEKTGGEFEGCGPAATGGRPRTWSPIAPMNRGRLFGATVADAAGRVFALGGWNDIQSYQAHVERYDPAGDQWLTVAPLPRAQSGHAAAQAGGLIYLVGGFDGTNPLATAQVYDPVADSWDALPPMSLARDEVAAAAGEDGRIYVFGGYREDPGTVTNTGEVFDPSTGGWSPIAPMPAARFDHAAVLGRNGEIYVFGGLVDPATGVSESTAWAYNPKTNSWRTLANLPAPRSALAAAVNGLGLAYAIGGDVDGVPVNTTFRYDPVADRWTQVASMGTPRQGLGAATAADGRIIATGGYDGVTFSRTAEAFSQP